MRENLEIFDRVGGGDSFASGLIYGFLTSGDPQAAVNYGAAHGALAMTTPVNYYENCFIRRLKNKFCNSLAL